MWEVYGSWPSWCARPGTDGQTPAECFLVQDTDLAGMSSVQAWEREVDSDPTLWGRATQHHPITTCTLHPDLSFVTLFQSMRKYACGVWACVCVAACAKGSNTGVFVTAQMQPFQRTAHGEKKKSKEKLRPTLHRFTAYVNCGCSVCWPFLTAGPLWQSQFTSEMFESDKRRVFRLA